MDNLEINTKVCEKLRYICAGSACNDFIWMKNKTSNLCFLVNYCDDWERTGKIMTDNRIDLRFSDTSDLCYAYNLVQLIETDMQKNPLRAVLLCFLEMEI